MFDLKKPSHFSKSPFFHSKTLDPPPTVLKEYCLSLQRSWSTLKQNKMKEYKRIVFMQYQEKINQWMTFNVPSKDTAASQVGQLLYRMYSLRLPVKILMAATKYQRQRDEKKETVMVHL